MSEINLSSLLDISLDQLADMPEFKVLPPGAHKVVIKFESKKIIEHPSVEAKFTLLETLELSDTTSTPCEPGTECNVAYMLDNEFGQGKFKELMKPLCAHHGVTNLAQAVEASQGMEVVIVTKTRQNKDKTQTYLEVVSLTVI